MTRIKVKSSNIASIGYDEEKKDLEVEFIRGAVYVYSNVPKYTHARLMSSPSKGVYFAKFIKNRFTFKRV